MGKRKQLDDDDFPVSTEKDKVVTREQDPLATAEDEETAEDIAQRLNNDAWRRQEDNWSA